MKGIGSEQRFGEEYWLPRNFRDDLPRPAPTSEEKEAMKNELFSLGNIFRGYRRWWQIDGALNIFLRSQTDIFNVFHRDIDVSLREKDVFSLEKYLLRRGYGLFLYRKEKIHNPAGFVRIFKRVGAADFRRSDDWQLRIAVISEDGRICLGADLVFIDVALISETGEGKFFGWLDIPLPDHWLSYKRAIVFSGEVVIYLSHPARFFLSKLFFFRRSDEDDLTALMTLQIITLRDLEDIENILKEVWRKYKDRILVEMKDGVTARIERFRASLR